MIRYTLKCSADHAFDSWFKSASAFDALLSGGRLSCPHCGTDDVRKSLMAPRVRTARQKDTMDETGGEAVSARDVNDESGETGSVRTPEDRSRAMVPSAQNGPVKAPDQDAEHALKKMRDHVEQNSDYVGADFASEARKMKEGEAPSRSIYGEAKLDEAKALIEEGIPVLPLPFTARRKLN